MHRKNIIKLFSIFFMLAIFLIIFQGNVNATSPKLTHISIKTDNISIESIHIIHLEVPQLELHGRVSASAQRVAG